MNRSPDHAPESTRTDVRPRSVNALVTGGAGFIGSNLTDLLLNRGSQVTVIDDLSTGRRENLPDHHPRLQFIHSPLAEVLHDLDPTNYDEIYHLAAGVGVRRVVQNAVDVIERNTLDVIAILRFCSRVPAANAPNLLIASSSEVYGKSAKVPFSEHDDSVYGPTTSRRWSYALTKALAEHLALAHFDSHALPVVIVRLFNTVGPRQVGQHGMVLPRFVECALKNLPLEVHGDGSQTRCFCDVRDVVPSLVSLLQSESALGKVVNIGSDRELTLRELAETVNRTLASTAGIRFIPYHDALGPGFEDLPRRRPALETIRSLIQFTPRITLEQTILDLADDIRGRCPPAPEMQNACEPS